LRFAQEGADLVICDLHEGRNKEWAERIRSETSARVLDFHLDIGDRDAVDGMIAAADEELGGVDVLICNAAENKLGHLVEYDPGDWDRTIDVSLSANFYLTRKVLPGMVERRRGNLIYISSVAGWIGNPNEEEGEPAYSVAKAGLFSLMRNVAAEVGPHGIRANAIAPGLLDSRFVRKFADQFEPLRQKTPLRKFGTGQDVVEAALFLASEHRASFITGESLNVSGGWYMRP
jgi:3-oxoacyl-[acyl-carrier protein] reductase